MLERLDILEYSLRRSALPHLEIETKKHDTNARGPVLRARSNQTY
ncbi:hypothetical protein [Streptococcus suis]|nr:hypothetical protein [Streptococcus suis]